jgi:predicted dehydrogenase
MATVLRWGLLGTARINRAIIPALRQGARHELVAVASRREDVARAYAAEWSIPRAYGSYEALLAAGDIDAVYIPLPNGLHAEWSIRAVEAGKHVLCEKPLALTTREVDAMAAAAARHGRAIAEAFMYRHHPQTARVRDLVRDGALGTVRVVRGGFSFWLNREHDVRFDPAMGGGSLWDVGCYPISYARHVLGEEPVEADGSAAMGPTGVDLTFVGHLRFPSGAFLQFDSGFRSHLRSFIEVVGTDAVLHVPNPFKPGLHEHCTLQRGDLSETIAVEGAPLYLGEVDDVAAAALDGAPPRVSLADSRANVAAIVACHESARTGRTVPLAPG